MFRRRAASNGNYFSDAVSYFSNNADPQAALWAFKSRTEMTHQGYMGVGPGGAVVWTPPNTHLLVIGPAQGHIGKSGAVAAPAAIQHFGNAVVVGTKWDNVRSVALPRYRVGAGQPLWYYDPTGPAEPGFEELRWSPLRECTNDRTTTLMVDMLVDAAHARGRIKYSQDHNSAHFDELAKPLCHGLLRYANGHDLDMRWIGEQLQIKDYKGLDDIANWLQDVGSIAWGAVAGYADHGAGGREIHSVFTTAQIIFEPWTTDEAIASMTKPNFDPVDFASQHGHGQVNPWLVDPDLYSDATHPGYALARSGVLPNTGIFETIIICIPSDRQLLAAPLIITLLGAITKAAMAQKGVDERAGRFGRPNVGFILDELANLAPLPQLPSLLTQGASQGVTVYGCLQTGSQALHRWGDREGQTVLANFGNLILLPGVTDQYTLDWFEHLAGDTQRQTRSESLDGGGNVGVQVGSERISRFPRDVLRSGHPQSPDLALMVQGGVAMDWAYCAPVHRARPWLPLLLGTFEYVMSDEHVEERPAGALMPAPDLDRHRNGQYLTADQRQRFYAALARRDQLQEALKVGAGERTDR